ncbi:MAG: Gfo/Idh/MocA family oxidoreductase [Bryobacteraceae bacterium]
MQRRDFSKLIGTGVALPAFAQPAPPRQVTVAMIAGPGGSHLNYYFESLAMTEEVSAIYYCDPSGQSRALAEKLLGKRLTASYPDIATLFRKEQPGLALISMEAVASPPVIDAALDAGCHVLAEKPGCVRIEDFEKLNHKAKAKKRELLLALGNRIDPVILEAKRIVHEGKIGKVYGVEVHLIADHTRLTRPTYGKSWQAQKAKSGGGHLIWLGIHWLDLATFITESPVRAVTAMTANIGGLPFDVEDSAVVTMQFANGALGTMTSGYYLDKGYHSHIKVWGSKGWLQVHKHTELPLEWYSTLDADPQIKRWEKPKRATGDMYPIFIRSVARGCVGLDDFPLNGDDSLAALKNVFACYRSAETGKMQRV